MTPEQLSPDDVAHLPLLWSGDVVVVGGGSAGAAAAVAAARSGASTLLVEAAAYLGGTGATVLDTFYGFYAPGSGERVVGGIGWEVCRRLLDEGEAFERPNTYGAGTGVTYEPEALKLVWDDLAQTAGVDVLLHALMSRVVVDGGAVTGLVLETKAGSRRVEAPVVVDASGDAEVAWRAGAAVERPAPDRRVQPLTQTFRLGGVDASATPTAELHRLMREAVETSAYDLPRTEGSVHRTTLAGVVHTNLTRVSGVDPTDPWELSRAERAGRRQVREYTAFLRDRVPGYEEAYLVGSAARAGVRESRRLVGEHVLTGADVLSARRFPDDIARCGAPVEDHDGGAGTVWRYVGADGGPSGQTYGIPYRCLLPVAVDGLLVAGRCLSATHDAHASARSMGQCMAMGQAAGTAAALSVASGAPPRQVDVAALRAALLAADVLL